MRVLLSLVLLAACRPTDSPHPAPPPPASPPPPSNARIAAALPPTLPTATVSWSLAETDPTPANWDAAGDAFAAELSHCTTGCAELAKREVLARQNALVATGEINVKPSGDAPEPLPPRTAAFVAAMDNFVAHADPSDPDVPKYAFIAASTMYRYHQPDAIARCEAILRDHRDTELAEYAANELLDLLLSANKTADLKFWVTDLLADTTFLEGKDALRDTLQQLRTRLDSPG